MLISSLIVIISVVAYISLQTVKENLPEKQPKFVENLKTITSKNKKVCLTNEEYEKVTDPNAPVLSMPFNLEDYSTMYWGIIPFCAKVRSGMMHGALDFELKPDSKVYASTDGVVEYTHVGEEEGTGEVIGIKGNGFVLDYSGLTNLQIKTGDKVKRRDYIANAVRIPHGEHHVHMGLVINEKQECPLKYMDEEFLQAFEQMFAQADYRTQASAPCACNCESIIPNY